MASLTRSELIEKFTDLEQKWKTPGTPEGLGNLLNIFNITSSSELLPDHIEKIFETDWKAYSSIRRDLAILDDEDDDDMRDDESVENLEIRFSEFQNAIYYGKDSLLSFLRMTNCNSTFPPAKTAEILFWMSPMDLSDLKNPQIYILYLLGSLYRSKYRRLDDSVFEQIFINGKATRAWKEKCSIESQIRSYSSKEKNFDMWKIMTENFERSVKYITDCQDVEFPDLICNRRVWSFEDGIYNASDDTFCYYEQHTDDNLVSSKIIRKPFAQTYFSSPPSSISRLSYGEINTPLFDSIVAPQKWDKDMVKWLFVFIGRLFYEVNEHDSWQVIPFLKGVAGCGKSLIIKIIQSMYPVHAVGVLSNNVEKKFGLSSVIGKSIFIMPEIKGDFGLDQAEFQSIVTGEDVSLARKHDAPWSGKWVIPGFMAGNESVGFQDKSGSISRRLVVLDFPNRIKPSDVDPTLYNKIIDSELPSIIRKCTIAYQNEVRLHGNADIWTALPPRTCEERKKLMYSTSSIYSFMVSDRVEIESDSYTLESVFITQLKTFAALKFANSTIAWTEDFYGMVFQDFGIRMTTEELPWPMHSQNIQKATYIHGCRVSMAD